MRPIGGSREFVGRNGSWERCLVRCFYELMLFESLRNRDHPGMRTLVSGGGGPQTTEGFLLVKELLMGVSFCASSTAELLRCVCVHGTSVRNGLVRFIILHKSCRLGSAADVVMVKLLGW